MIFGINTVILALIISSLEYSVKFENVLLTFLMKTFPYLIYVWMEQELMSKRSTTIDLVPDWMMKILFFSLYKLVPNDCNILLLSFSFFKKTAKHMY